MKNSRFDIAIVGNRLAARMAAALLAKQGKRLILVGAPGCPDPWQHSSLFLDKLLATLGGLSQVTPGQAFQVLSRRARVTVHREVPLAGELQREFGGVAQALVDLLDGLEKIGRQLELLLWEYGGLPGQGLRAAASWRWLCLRRKLPLNRLGVPLADHLRQLPESAAEWLSDLFQGLSLQPLTALTVADGALLWAHARHPTGIAEEELSALLHKRLEQFHGVEAGLADLASLEYRNHLWTVTLHSGGSFQAGQLVLGDLDGELPLRDAALPLHPVTPSQQLVTTALDGQLSPLLESRVIAGGALPLRMVTASDTTGMTASISTSVLADEAQIRRQLAPVLPFADYSLHGKASGHNTLRLPDPSAAAPSLFKLPIGLGSRLWCTDETRLLPHLGLGGAALLAWTLVHQLNPKALANVS